MEFHETVRGARFYDGQVPQLINNLDRIATVLEKLADKETEESVWRPLHCKPKTKKDASITKPPFPGMHDDRPKT